MYNIFLFFSFILLFFSNPLKNISKEYITVEIEPNLKVKAEVANTPFKRAKGLMFKEPLEKNEGMLFIFPKEKAPSFYNKNVKFNVLVLWVNKDLKVTNVSILNKNSFKTERPNEKILYVLELNADKFSNPQRFIGKTLKFL